MATQSRELLESLFRDAVAAAHPSRCLPPHLPEPPSRGRLIVLAAGKAAGSLTEVAEQHYLARIPENRLDGIAVTRHGYGRPTKLIRVVEAGHPVPDEAGLAGAEKMLTIADSADAADLVLVLLSGGASANLIAPTAGISFADKQATTRAILRSGANIGEFNCVRKHLSRIKGGRLAKRAHPAKVVTLAISDVPGDDPAVIGSGTDRTGPDDARRRPRHRRQIPSRTAASRVARARRPGQRIAEARRRGIRRHRLPHYRAAGRCAGRRPGPRPRRPATTACCSATSLQGEAREVAAEHARLARDYAAQGRRIVILSGGELTVTLGGQERPRRTQSGICPGARHPPRRRQRHCCHGIACRDTDGTDGGQGRPDDPAGAFIDATTVKRARAAGLDPAAFLADNDSTGFFNGIGDLYTPGPTFTNVNDFRAIVVDTH